MQQMRDALGRPLGMVLAVSALAALGLAACGGSGSSSTATQANLATTNTSSRSGAAAGSGAGATGGKTVPRAATGAASRFAAVRKCLQKQGIRLPSRPGSTRGGFLGGANLPKGVTRVQLQRAMSKCLGGRGFPAGHPGAAHLSRPGSSRFRQALSLFAACLRKNGVNVAQPNTSGNGPVFSTKGLNTASPQFKAATAKCRTALSGALGVGGARPGAGG